MSEQGTGQRGFDASMVPPADWLRPQVQRPRDCGVAYLLLVTVLALILRLWRLDAMSLWIDEIMTWNLIAPGRGLDFREQILLAYQGPLYPAVAWPLLRLQESAFMLRLPAVLAGVAAVPLLGMFAAHLWGRQSGRMAALLLAVSPFAVWYAQEGRGYSFVILFSVAAGWVMVKALTEGMSGRRAAALALLGFAGLASNISFLFLLTAFGLSVLLVARPRCARDWWLWGVGLGGGLVLALPWLLTALGIWEIGRVVPGATTGEALRGDTTFSIWALPFTGHAFFYGYTLGPSLTALHGADRVALVRESWPLLTLGALVAGAAFLIGLTRLSRRRWHLLLWIIVPLCLVILLAVRNIKPFNVRYVATAFPWVLALAAAGIGRQCRWGRLVLGGGLCLLSLVSLAGLYYGEEHAKEDVRGAVAAITAAGGPERPLLVPAVGPVVRHYWQGSSPVIGLYDEPLILNADMADATARRRLAGHDEAWIVWARSWDLDPHTLLPGALARIGTLERIHTGPQVAVDLWRRRPPPTENP